MKNSTNYFCNTECEHYPCHNGIENINCLFCYCPLYTMEKCLGNYIMKEADGKIVKDCTNCLFPHLPENYEKIMELLKNE